MSGEIEYSFKVRLSEVSAKFSTVPEGVLAAGSTPFFRCDFDGKLLQSENCSLPGDPVWTYRTSFEYRLLEPGIDALVASLASRSVSFEVLVSDGSRNALIGRCAVDLLSIATGAHKFQLRLTPAPSSDGSMPADPKNSIHANATLSFNLMMEQQSVVHLNLQQLTFAALSTPTATKLHYLLLEGGSAIETSVLTPTSTPYFDMLPPVQCRTSMRSLLSTSVRVTLLDAMRGDAPIGTLDIPLSEVLLSADEIGSATGNFKKNLYSSREYHQNFTALVTGTIVIERLPAFAQLASGQNVDGEISGKPLLPSCFLPPRYVKRPTRLPDYQHRPMPLAISGDQAAGSAYAFARSNQGGGGGNISVGSGTYIPAQVSSLPALQSPQRKMYEPSFVTGVTGQAVGGQPQQYQAIPGGSQPFRSPHRPNTATGAASATGNAGNINNSSFHNRSSSSSHHNAIPKSPVASATETLIEQQDDAYFVLDQQANQLTQTRQELIQRIQEEHTGSQERLDGLAAEEHTIKEKLAALGGQISYLHNQLEAVDGPENTGTSQAAVERITGGLGGGPIPKNQEEQQQQQLLLLEQEQKYGRLPTSPTKGPDGRTLEQMETELNELNRISKELDGLQDNLRLHVEVDGTLRRTALDLVERSRTQLDSDNQALAEVEYRITNPLNTTTGANSSSMARSSSLQGGGGDGQDTKRTLSPRRHENANYIPHLGLPGQNPSTSNINSYPNSATNSQMDSGRDSWSSADHAALLPSPPKNPKSSTCTIKNSGADSVYSSPTRAPTGSTKSELVVAAVGGGGQGSARRSGRAGGGFVNPTLSASASSTSPPRNPHTSTTHQPSHATVPSLNSMSSVSAADISAAVIAATPMQQQVADPMVQAMNTAIVNNDIAGIYAAARGNARAIHPRSLLLACTQRSPNPRVVDTLLELKPQLLQMTDASSGRTALHCACATDVPNSEAVRILLDAGASMNEYDAEGLSPFHVALLNVGDFGNILRHALLDYGANPMQPTQGGSSPALICSTSDSHLEALMFLKGAGANLHSPAPDQKRIPSTRAPPARSMTPLEKADQCGAVGVRRFLLRYPETSSAASNYPSQA